MTEESGDVAETVGFVTVNGLVVGGKRLFEILAPNSVEFAESFANEAVEVRVRAFLGTTLNDHVA